MTDLLGAPATSMHPTPQGHVVVVDDEHSILTVLCEYLTIKGYRCSTFDSAEGFCEWLSSQKNASWAPICLLCDVAMPGMDGLALQQCLRHHPEIAVVMMSGAASNLDVVKAFRGGAVDFLLKPLDDSLMFDVLDRALAQSWATSRKQERQAFFSERVAQLTRRELDTLRLVARGRLNREIADEFGIALRTVKLYRQRGFEKLGINLNVELVRLLDEGHLC